ncbi:unknown [Haloarcula marismortui ATCC 43049]|uniref:Uncharacterized protein n=1 Tax=Haloarcula marismortui (strain ATCC 43049 / DSM 3752 / JCM 8966 / VKM B-1809) TaxID=272569 RepID=Q5V3C3_HALMA|nr:hypothetical protein [Haloarcula marismortui]AAV45979.1 unknown [Haloarcula marismortui ATCC 43049]QCP90748.1 hypothetical protein E6P14_07670 [Haloarcula marismortui ATCC 43049]
MNKKSKSIIVIGLLSISGLIMSIRLGISTIPLLIIYSAVFVVATRQQSSLSSVVLSIAFIIFVGGILAYQSGNLRGFSDVFLHTYVVSSIGASINSVPAGNVSLGYPGLYIFTVILQRILNIGIVSVARLVPLFSVVIFGLCYIVFADSYLLKTKFSAVAAVLFVTNWGIFRFATEYRTLSVALIGTICLLILLTRSRSFNKEQMIILGILFSALVIITHFATSVFTLIIIFSVFSSEYVIDKTHFAERDIKIGGLWLILVLYIVILYAVSVYAFDTFSAFVSTVSSQIGFVIYDIASLVTTTEQTTPDASPEGLVGLTYGFLLFVSQWLIRLIYMFTFFALLIQIHRKQKIKWIQLVFITIPIGLLLFIPLFLGSTISPSRIFTFFAIPYGIIMSYGLKSLASTNKLNRIAMVIMFALVALVLLTNFMKLPHSTIGPTFPIRGSEPVDQLVQPWLVSHGDIAIRNFLGAGNMENLDKLSVSPEYVFNKQMGTDGRDIIYSNGNRYILK